MNSNNARNSSISSNYESKHCSGPVGQLQPSSKMLFESYRGSPESSDGGRSRFSSYNQPHSRNSALLNPEDPLSMHLLMETAIGDSQQYEIMSFEEIEYLKRQLSLLSSRIDGTRRKLILESKLRDAALSLNRLHSSSGRESMIAGSANRHRRSAMGSRGSTSDYLTKTDDELAISTRKCEELAQELWKLERREQELQRRFLEHTAGVLQMTHKGYLKTEIPPPSPDSTADYLNGREIQHLLDGNLDFDDHSFYQTLDMMLDIKDGERKLDSKAPPTEDFAHHTETILETERRLEDLNRRLRDSIMLTSKRSQQLPPLHVQKSEGGGPMNTVQEQLNCLEKGFEIMQEDQNTSSQSAKRLACVTEERLEGLNTQLHSMITRSNEGLNAQYPGPPVVSGNNDDAQIRYLEEGLDIVEQTIQHFTNAGLALSSKAACHEDKSRRFENVLLGLWDILRVGEGQTERDIPQTSSAHEEFSLQAFSAKVQSLYTHAKGLHEQKELLGRQIQQQRELNSKSEAEKDVQFLDLTLELAQSKKSLEILDGEADESRDKLALMMGRIDTLQHEATLREQQRKMDDNSTLQAEKGARMKNEEHLIAELQAKQDALQAEKAARIETEEHLYAELQSKQDEIAKLQEELQELKDDSGIANAETLAKLADSEKCIQDLASQLEALNEDLEHHKTCEAMLEESVGQKTKEVERAHLEMENLESDMVRLQTEVTVARAELDGAYGTRAQRAAEVATNPAIQKELDDLTAKNSSLLGELASLKAQQENMGEGNAEMARRVQVLQRELSGTISEYEVMTKSSIEFEKEREQLENAVDGLRDRCESLESELSDERVRWLGMKIPPSSGGRDSHPPGTTSTMVLKNEFKKMMRETRAENLKALRFEQEERRKLEALVRSLKRDQTPGKSSLSQSMTAT